MKLGDTVTRRVVFGGDELYTGVIVAEDADISREAIIIETKDGGRFTMLNQSIVEHQSCTSKADT